MTLCVCSAALMLVDPSAGPPNTTPNLAGEYTGTLYWYWSDRESSGRVDYIGKIMFGDYHCYVSEPELSHSQDCTTAGLGKPAKAAAVPLLG